MKLILAVRVLSLAVVVSEQNYNYEKMHQFGLGRRIHPRVQPNQSRFYPLFETAQHPSPLPYKRRPFIASPYRNLTQGIRRKGDIRVYLNKFDYPERDQGQQVFFRGDYNCLLSRLAVDTEGCLPTLLRGGVGYRHFIVLVRAAAGVPLRGRVRAWCRNHTDKYQAW